VSRKIQSLTAAPSGGQTVDGVAQELAHIMEDFGIDEGYIIHNDRRYRVKSQKPYTFYRDPPCDHAKLDQDRRCQSCGDFMPEGEARP
jgi:hypothetical protein